MFSYIVLFCLDMFGFVLEFFVSFVFWLWKNDQVEGKGSKIRILSKTSVKNISQDKLPSFSECHSSHQIKIKVLHLT